MVERLADSVLTCVADRCADARESFELGDVRDR